MKGHSLSFQIRHLVFYEAQSLKLAISLLIQKEALPFHLYLKACRPDRPNLEFVRAAMENEENYIQENASQCAECTKTELYFWLEYQLNCLKKFSKQPEKCFFF